MINSSAPALRGVASIALVLSLAYCGGAASAAEPAASAISSEPAEELDANAEGKGDDIVVTGTHRIDTTRARLNLVAGSVAVVDNSRVEKASVANLADVLAFQPGVYVQNDSGSDAVKISIRGSGMNGGSQGYRRGLYFMFDGLPLTGPGATPVDLIEPFGIDHTEVQIGANAFDVGATQLGGSINLVSKTGATASPFAARLEGGTYGYFKAQLSTGGITGPLDYYVSVTAGKRDGFQPNSENKTLGFEGVFNYQVSPKVTTSLFIRARYRYSENPGQITLGQLEVDPRSGIKSYQDNRSRSIGLPVWVGSKTTVETSSSSTLTAGLVFHYHPWLGYYATSRLNQPVYNDLSATLRYQRRDTLWGADSVTTAGFTSLNSTNEVVTNTRPLSTRQLIYQNGFNGTNNTWYLTNDLGLSSVFHLQTGAALVRTWGQGVIRKPVESPEASQTYWNFAPRVGVRFDLPGETQVFANLSRSIEAAPTFAYPSAGTTTFSSGPATGQLSNVRPLFPQKAYTEEVGARGKLPGGKWSLAFYRATIRDELLQTQFTVGSGASSYILTQQSNASPTIHRGIEAGFELELWKAADGTALSTRQSYTYSDFHYRHDASFGQNKLPGIPAHYYQAELTLQRPNGPYLTVNAQVASKNYLDYANSQAAPHYSIFGARVGTSLARKIDLFLDLRNLANKTYAEAVTPVYSLRSANTPTISPGDGRAVIGGLSLKY